MKPALLTLKRHRLAGTGRAIRQAGGRAIRRTSGPSTRLIAAVAVLLSVLLWTGCATVGTIEEERIDAIALAALPQERSAYLYMDVASGAGFLEEAALLVGTDSRRLESLLNDLRFVYVAAESGNNDWTCIAAGRIRTGSYASALNLNKNWKRVRGLGRYWISTDSDLEVALPGRQVAVLGNSQVQPVVERLAGVTAVSATDAAAARTPAPGAAAPGVTESGAAGASNPALELYRLVSRRPNIGFAAYLDKPLALLPLQLPARLSEGVTAVVTGGFTDDSVETELTFSFPSPATARVAGVLVKTLIIAELRKAGNGETAIVEVSVQGNTVRVSPVIIAMHDAVAFLLPFVAGSGESP